MKKACIMVVIIILVSMAEAGLPRGWQRSTFQFEPRPAIYINNDVEFDISANLIFNPSRYVGFRVQAAQIYFSDETIFRISNSFVWLEPTLETLIYIPIRESMFQPYAVSSFTLLSVSDFTLVGFGVGGGADIYVTPKVGICFEPAVMFFFAEGESEVIFRGAIGLKFGT